MPNNPVSGAISVDPGEVEKFSSIASEWWNENGSFGVLHKFNPVRIEFITGQATARFGLDPLKDKPLAGLDLLDIGCGGGLLSEPLARLGAKVTAIDPSQKNIKTAMVHASEQGLDIAYRATTAEELAASGNRFDIVLNMEVIEHVSDPATFIKTCASLVRPGGLMFTATLNRTLKAFGLAIIGAEYILGWMPKGTHQWEKFITPRELEDWLKAAGMKPLCVTGATFNILKNTWQRSSDTDVNYMIAAPRPGPCKPSRQ
ncbi:MAG TPA: bifunctional 2-polyprenyl-6-hydroxyphenol methylase/3-demethylubiquinol 3-O-methyltransferase UbiG [Rhizobiales bacterium]|nr:bifunctional 2-polyprenyl-6-hydroxyphenol methylase/3-demethylubiquinol 3-O-methyltransferase UbiG [Hyphomicrobiales bacterium]